MARLVQDLLWILAFCLALAMLDARAQDLSRPVMLVASPSFQGFYGRTVIIVTPVAGFHVGFIVNRPTTSSLAALLPFHAAADRVSDTVYFGGSEMSDTLFAIVKGDPGGGAWCLFGDYFVASSEETIERIIERTPNDARYFAGFMGWLPGELELEIAAGLYLVTEPDPFMLRRDPSGAWESLISKLGRSRAIRHGSVNASLERGPGAALSELRVPHGSGRSNLGLG